jgi:hypothetical protein
MPMAMPAPAMAPMAQPMSPYDPLAGSMNPYALAMPNQSMPPPAPPPQMVPDRSGYGGGLEGASLDPMAPVTLPGLEGPPLPGDPAWNDEFDMASSGAARALPGESTTLMNRNPAAVPMGKAVPAASAPTGFSAVEKVPGTRPLPGPEFRGSSSAELMASRNEAQSQRTILVAGIGGGIALLALGFAYLIYSANKNNNPVVAHVDPEVNIDPESGPAPIGRTVESTPPTIPQTPIRPPVSPTKPMPMPTPPMPQPMPNPPPMPTPMPVAPMPKPMPDPVPPPPMPPMPTPMPPAPMPTPPTPTPTPTPPTPMPPPMPEATPPTKAELAALGKACTTAKDALAEQNFDEAGKLIAQAESLAKLPDHKAKVARLKEVAGYVKQFRDALALAVQGLEAAEVIKVGSSAQVAIVETFPDKLIIRSLGANKTFTFADMPAGLAIAIADRKLDGTDPVSRVVKGAYLAVQKRADSTALDKAKSFWEEAQLGGADVAPVMPFLTDTYDFEKDAK